MRDSIFLTSSNWRTSAGGRDTVMVSVVLMEVGKSYSVRLILNNTRLEKFVKFRCSVRFTLYWKDAKTAHVMEGMIISGSHTEL